VGNLIFEWNESGEKTHRGWNRIYSRENAVEQICIALGDEV